jgi:hypothetical protein
MRLETRAAAAVLAFIAGAPLAQAQTISPAVNASYFITLAPRSEAAEQAPCLQQVRSIKLAVNGKVEVATDRTSRPESDGRCLPTQPRSHD